MELRQLELFVLVADAGSIHAGARLARTPQPSVSKALSKLERQVGVSLMIRSSHGVSLTKAGKALLDESRGILNRIDRLPSIVADVTNERRTLTVGLLGGAVAAAELTNEIAEAFREQCPDVALRFRELSFVDQFDAVADEVVDVAIVRPPSGDPRLDLIPLFEEPRVLCCRHDHRFAKSRKVGMDDIVNETFVSLEGAPTEWSSFWQLDEQRGGPASVSGTPALTPSELQFALIYGDAVMSLALSAWRTALSAETLRAIPLDDAATSHVAIALPRKGADHLASVFSVVAQHVCRKRISRVQRATLPA